jgi:hypothetical protein
MRKLVPLVTALAVAAALGAAAGQATHRTTAAAHWVPACTAALHEQPPAHHHKAWLERDPRRVGCYLNALAGWATEWPCLDRLWGPLESSWQVTADNPNSDAYGIPQALPGSKMGPGWESSAWVQVRWGLGYIRGRYGSPCGALGYRLAHGYY